MEDHDEIADCDVGEGGLLGPICDVGVKEDLESDTEDVEVGAGLASTADIVGVAFGTDDADDDDGAPARRGAMTPPPDGESDVEGDDVNNAEVTGAGVTLV